MSDTIHKQIICEDSITINERSSDPSDPDSGSSVIWVGDGTGTGDDGDFLIKNNNGSSTITSLLSTRTPYVQSIRTTDLLWNNTNTVNITSISITTGTWILYYSGSISVPNGVGVSWLSNVSASSATAISGTERIVPNGLYRGCSAIVVYEASSSETIYWNLDPSSTNSTNVAVDVVTTGAGPAADNNPVLLAIRLI